MEESIPQVSTRGIGNDYGLNNNNDDNDDNYDRNIDTINDINDDMSVIDELNDGCMNNTTMWLRVPVVSSCSSRSTEAAARLSLPSAH